MKNHRSDLSLCSQAYGVLRFSTNDSLDERESESGLADLARNGGEGRHMKTGLLVDDRIVCVCVG